jgi:hypothetical protein
MPKSIHSTVMLGSLSISFPEMRRNAKDEARKIETDANAKTGTITAAKHLMAGVAEHKIVKDDITQFRAWWSKVTLPWFDGKGSPRAVASLAVPDLQVEIGDRIRAVTSLYADFLRKYPQFRAHRQFEMGDLFDPRQFPSPDEMKRKFAIRVDWYPLPNAKDIRVIEGMDSAELEQIAKEARESEQRRLARAMENVAQRLHKVVKSMHETMATPIGEAGAKFNDSKLENILAVAELIPKLNLTGDPKLYELAKEAKKLATKSPVELREDEVKRASAAKEAKSLADKLSGMFTQNDDEDE